MYLKFSMSISDGMNLLRGGRVRFVVPLRDDSAIQGGLYPLQWDRKEKADQIVFTVLAPGCQQFDPSAFAKGRQRKAALRGASLKG